MRHSCYARATMSREAKREPEKGQGEPAKGKPAPKNAGSKPKTVKRPPTTDRGAMETAVASNLDRLRRADAINPDREALCELALTLARTLDDGAGMAVAAVARELRATLDALVRSEAPIDDDISRFITALSTPIRDTTQQ